MKDKPNEARACIIEHSKRQLGRMERLFVQHQGLPVGSVASSDSQQRLSHLPGLVQ